MHATEITEFKAKQQSDGDPSFSGGHEKGFCFLWSCTHSSGFVVVDLTQASPLQFQLRDCSHLLK